MDDTAISKDGGELKVEKTIQPCPPLALPQQKQTTSIKVSVNDYNLLFGHMDPNQLICQGIIPDVKSWNELFNETVPRPHVWQMPYIGVGEPMAGGGITTHGFQVKEESRVKTKVPSSETPWVDQYPKRGSQLAVRAQWQTNQGRYIAV